MVDRYITMYEYERTESTNLDAIITDLKSRLLNSNAAIFSKKAQLDAELTSSKLQKRATFLQHQLEIVLAKVNSTATVNRKLRDEIDTMRSSAVLEQDGLGKLHIQCKALLERKDRETEVINRELSENKRLARATSKLRSKSTSQLVKYSETMKSLAVSAKQKELRPNSPKVLRNKLNMTVFDPRPKKSSAECFEPSVILKLLLAKLSKLVNTEKAKLASLIHREKEFRRGLQTVRAVTGIEDLDEFVTTFIKSEEQKAALTAYFENMQREIDSEESERRRHHTVIDEGKGTSWVWELNKLEAKEALQTGVERESNKLRELKGKLTKLQTHLSNAFDIARRIIDSLQSHGYSISTRDFGVNSTDSLPNLKAKLVPLEGIINEIVLYLAIKYKNPVPSHKLIDSLKRKLSQSHTSRDPKREVLKLNETLTTYSGSPDIPLNKRQLKLRAKSQTSKILSMSTDELPMLYRRKTMYKKRISLICGGL